jgi:ribosomal protein S16
MIRLSRIGKPKQPYYRVVVIEKERAAEAADSTSSAPAP